MKPKQMRTKKSTKETENFAFYGTKSQKLKNETEKIEKNGKKKNILKKKCKICVLRHKSCSEFCRKNGKKEKKREKKRKKEKKIEKTAK